jgi:type II restriction enzyme
MYCVACGDASLRPHPNNARANDFFCTACGANFELKSGRKAFGATVPDGAFATMIERLEQPGGGPHLALLHNCADALTVRDLLVLPASFLTRDVILRRPPLKPSARRAGWVGCNIRIGNVPAAGRIAVVRDGTPMPKADVLRGVQRAASVRGDLAARTWLVDALRCVERLGPEFTLSEIYAFEAELRERHPANQHIRPKLRQQLQRLRDAGLLLFLGDGRYRRIQG